MSSLDKARVALLINISCFVFGFWLLVSRFNYLHDKNLVPKQILEMLVLDRHHFIVWNLFVYVAFGLSLLYLTVNIFFCVKKRTPELAIGILIMGGVWSGFMLLSGGLAIELINSVVDHHTRNRDLAINVWVIGNLLHESVGGGNEIIGAIWVGLISCALPSRKRITIGTKFIGYIATVLGLCTIFESSETFASLFGSLLILWFMLLFVAFPKAFTS